MREVLGYHAYDDAWVPDMLAGRTMDEVGRDAYSGDLLGDQPAANFANLVEQACAAALALDDLARVVHTSFGDFSAQDYLCQVNFFRGLRAHDLSGVLGLGVELPGRLVEGLWEELLPNADQWRAYGVFPAAVAVPDDAPLLDRLLGLAGRQPESGGQPESGA